MIRKKPALGLDPRVETGFPKRSCSIKMLERKSIQSEAISLEPLQIEAPFGAQCFRQIRLSLSPIML
jgi:hypothetical protein